MTNKTCKECGKSFSCEDSNCWCFNYPNIIQVKDTSDCLCPSCLKQTVIQNIDQFVQDFKRGAVENTAPQFNTPGTKPIEGIDYYIENGNYVFTSWSHLKRGHCCGSGCRHCPYPK